MKRSLPHWYRTESLLSWMKTKCLLSFLLTWRWIFLSLKSRGTDFVTFLGDLGKEQKFEVNRLLVLTMLDHARHQHGDHPHPPGDLRRGGGEVRRRPHPVSCPALHTSSGGARDLYPPKKLASISIYQVCYGVGTDGKTAHNDAARWLFCNFFHRRNFKEIIWFIAHTHSNFNLSHLLGMHWTISKWWRKGALEAKSRPPRLVAFRNNEIITIAFLLVTNKLTKHFFQVHFTTITSGLKLLMENGPMQLDKSWK